VRGTRACASRRCGRPCRRCGRHPCRSRPPQALARQRESALGIGIGRCFAAIALGIGVGVDTDLGARSSCQVTTPEVVAAGRAALPESLPPQADRHAAAIAANGHRR
jgi:hypothetical protein